MSITVCPNIKFTWNGVVVISKDIMRYYSHAHIVSRNELNRIPKLKISKIKDYAVGARACNGIGKFFISQKQMTAHIFTGTYSGYLEI